MTLACLAPRVVADWLPRLHLIEVPADMTLQSAELRLRGLLPWPLAGVLFVLGVALAVWLYQRESPRPGLAVRVALVGLRSALLALVLGLLMRPVLLAEFAGERPRAVVLLVDTSESMSQADRRVSGADRLRLAIALGLLPPDTSSARAAPLAELSTEQLADRPRIDLVKAVLSSERFDLQNRLAARGPLHPFLFDRRLRAAESDWTARISAAGARTALADAVVEVLMRFGPEPPAGVVVVTDGCDNASKRTLDEAAKACRDRGVPLHVWGVGSSEGGVLQVKEVRMPSTLFIDPKPEVEDDPFDVLVRFRCRGFSRGTVVLSAKLGDQEVTEHYPVEQGENLSRRLRFSHPKKSGEGERPVHVTLRFEPPTGQPAPPRPARDEIDRVVQVKNSRVKVLVVENVPRREYHFLQPALNRDRRVLLRTYLAEGDPQLFESRPDPESGSLFLEHFPDNFPEPHSADPDRRPYNLVILGDVPPSRLGDDGVKKLVRFVQEGGGLVMVAGRNHAPAEYVSTPLVDALPVEAARQEFPPHELAKFPPFRPVLTYDGEHSTVLLLADDRQESLQLWKEGLWKNTPGFEWFYPVRDLRPGAVSLLVHPDRKAGKGPAQKPMPLVASHYFGKGEVFFVGTDEVWRWRDGSGDRLTARFWGQVVARFGLPHLLGHARRSQLELEGGEPLLGRPGTVKARLLDPKFEPLTRAEVHATLVALDARDPAPRSRDVVLRRVPGQPGEYRAALPNDLPGPHELRLAGGNGLEAATLSYRVELPPRHELEEVGLAVEALRTAAAISGGGFYREEDLYRLPDAVAPRNLPFTRQQEFLLWNPLALALFVLLITAEWLLRKFSNLS